MPRSQRPFNIFQPSECSKSTYPTNDIIYYFDGEKKFIEYAIGMVHNLQIVGLDLPMRQILKSILHMLYLQYTITTLQLYSKHFLSHFKVVLIYNSKLPMRLATVNGRLSPQMSVLYKLFATLLLE